MHVDIHDSYPMPHYHVIFSIYIDFCQFLWQHLKCTVWVLVSFVKHQCSDMAWAIYGPGRAPLTISVWWRGWQKSWKAC